MGIFESAWIGARACSLVELAHLGRFSRKEIFRRSGNYTLIKQIIRLPQIVHARINP